LSLLDDELFRLRESYGDDAHKMSAKQYLALWCDNNAYLSKRYPDRGDEPVYDLTPSIAKAIEWLSDLKPKAFVGTESRLLTVFNLLREIDSKASESPERRIQELDGFERRFGFLYNEPVIRYRILDKSIFAVSAYRDVSIPLSEFAEHDIPGCHTVFITENKVNGLAFPPYAGGIVVFSLGYGVSDIAEAAWLKEKRVVYWGHIDSHSYGILSMLRGKLPHVESILMSSSDIDQHRSIASAEPIDTCRADALANLTPEEEGAYSRLLNGGDCEGMRIEQERIPFHVVCDALAALM